MGVPVARTKIIVCLVSGLPAGLAGALLLGVIQNLINQIPGLTSSFQQVVSGAFLAAVVVAHRILGRVRGET
ncbi:hypothetical protein [Planobispora longispora]|uniref:Uncharacterized protein n=1 Tax=Planobispora longispora TaxID=28887 RepID=A0A8J3RR62_9ACTN|nr:hypothetical protein [Planobispora longispora]BFE79850.1 hypothetical protein GCM10020093_024510 [Planobispora longispora]GIH76783.1 hypothetical protein Plo01_32120 [Planobispora longispora]